MPTNPTLLKRGHRAQRFTEAQVAQAVRDCRGVVTAVATKLGCIPGTVYDYVKRYPALADVLDQARESAIDFVESALMKAIEGGNVTAVIFFLKTQGRSRGYSDRPEENLETDFKFTLNIGIGARATQAKPDVIDFARSRDPALNA